MEGSEDEENAASEERSFSSDYKDNEREADIPGRSGTHKHSLERSEKSSWSGRSKAAGCDGVDTSQEDETGTSQESLQSIGKRSITREKSMSSYPTLHHQRGSRRFEGNGQEDFEFDQSSEGESQRGRGLSSEEIVTDENGEETVIETSCDETSFNTSIYSYKETGSSSELSVDPVMWKKFKFLSSILKVGSVLGLLCLMIFIIYLVVFCCGISISY